MGRPECLQALLHHWRDRVGSGGSQDLLYLADVHASKASLAEVSTGGDDLFVQALAISA